MTYFKRYKVHFIVVLAFLLLTFLYFPKLLDSFFTFHISQANFFYPNKNTIVFGYISNACFTFLWIRELIHNPDYKVPIDTSLPLFKAEKIKCRLYSSFYTDRTFIRNLSFIKQ